MPPEASPPSDWTPPDDLLDALCELLLADAERADDAEDKRAS